MMYYSVSDTGILRKETRVLQPSLPWDIQGYQRLP